jgi:hypothetical protein
MYYSEYSTVDVLLGVPLLRFTIPGKGPRTQTGTNGDSKEAEKLESHCTFIFIFASLKRSVVFFDIIVSIPVSGSLRSDKLKNNDPHELNESPPVANRSR